MPAASGSNRKQGSSRREKKNPVIKMDKKLTHTFKYPKRYLQASTFFSLLMAAKALSQDIYDCFSKSAPSRVNRYQVKGVAGAEVENGTA